MLDRENIDALLVGALYGELSSSDEALLTAHLESHPADRTALDDLKSVRAKWKASRIFELQLDPPQAVSAMLLQEAARRAPKVEAKKESWFQRFITSFVAHPAMAAAATLVLVVGVAGTMYLKGGDNKMVAEQTVAQDRGEVAKLPAPPTPAIGMANSESASAGSAAYGDLGGKDKNADDSMAVKLADEPARDPAEQQHAKGTFKQGAVAEHRASPPRDSVAFEANRPTPAPITPKQEAPAPSRKDYVEVGRNDQTVKELEDEERSSRNGAPAKADDNQVATATGGAVDSRTRSAGPGGGAPAVTSPPRAQATPSAPSVAAAAPEPPPPPPTQKAPSTELAWAKTEHAKVAALVKDGKCQEAAPYALAIKNRTPDYYATNVATDRALKPCMPYITDASVRTEKAAAAKRATDTK